MKCAIYARVSTDLNSQKDSLESQVSFFENFIQDKNWELVRTYSDEGISGTSTAKRLQLQQLMKDAERGEFNIILIKSISRWARDTVDSLTLIRKLKSFGVRVISVEDGFDSNTDDSEMRLTIFSMIAQQESESTSKRVSFGIAEKSRKGVFHGTPPFGYEKVDGKLVPHTIHSQTVKEIFNLYLKQGWGMQRIANHLTSLGVPTPRTFSGAKNAGEKWQQSAIKFILTNPHYTGNLMQGRSKSDIKDKVFNQQKGYKRRIQINEEAWIVVQDVHHALITQEEFDEVQEKIQNKAVKVFRGRGNKSLFARLAFCKDCGSGMNFKKDRQAYVCSTYQKNTSAKCKSHSIKYKDLKQMVISDLMELATNSLSMNSLVSIAQQRMKIKITGAKEELHRLRKEFDQLENDKRELVRLLTRHKIDEQTYDQQCELINSEHLMISRRIQEIEQLLSHGEETESQFNSFHKEILKFVELDLKDEELLRQVLHKLIDKVEIHDDGNIEIHYNFSNPMQMGA